MIRSAEKLFFLGADEFLTDSDFDQALFALLNSQVYNNHVDRMMSNIIATITPSAPSSTLFVALMLILHMGMTNPLSASINLVHSETKTSAKVFRIMRKRWNEVVPVLMKWVWDADVVHETHPLGSVIAGNGKGTESYVMPAEGWDERIGLASTLVLYEVCRVQKLSADELCECTCSMLSVHRTDKFVSSSFHLRIRLAFILARRADTRQNGRDFQLYPHQAYHCTQRAIHGRICAST